MFSKFILKVGFLGLGCLTMILLEWIGLETAPEHGKVSTRDTNWSVNCTLEKVDPSWNFPIHFTCNQNNTTLRSLT